MNVRYNNIMKMTLRKMMFIILNYVIPLIFFLCILWFYSLRFASEIPLVSSKSIAQTIFLHRLLHSYLHSKFFLISTSGFFQRVLLGSSLVVGRDYLLFLHKYGKGGQPVQCLLAVVLYPLFFHYFSSFPQFTCCLALRILIH